MHGWSLSVEICFIILSICRERVISRVEIKIYFRQSYVHTTWMESIFIDVFFYLVGPRERRFWFGFCSNFTIQSWTDFYIYFFRFVSNLSFPFPFSIISLCWYDIFTDSSLGNSRPFHLLIVLVDWYFLVKDFSLALGRRPMVIICGALMSGFLNTDFISL